MFRGEHRDVVHRKRDALRWPTNGGPSEAVPLASPDVPWSSAPLHEAIWPPLATVRTVCDKRCAATTRCAAPLAHGGSITTAVDLPRPGAATAWCLGVIVRALTSWAAQRDLE